MLKRPDVFKCFKRYYIVTSHIGAAFVDYLLVRKLTILLVLSDYLQMFKRTTDYKTKKMEFFLDRGPVISTGATRYDALLTKLHSE